MNEGDDNRDDGSEEWNRAREWFGIGTTGRFGPFQAHDDGASRGDGP